MTKLETNCRFCKKHIFMEVESEDWATDTAQTILKPLLAQVCCARCSDLYERKVRILGGVKKQCVELIQADMTNRREKVATKTREALIVLTKAYAQLISEYYNGTHLLWDDEFVQMLMQKPDEWNKIVNTYRTNYRRHYGIAALGDAIGAMHKTVPPL